MVEISHWKISFVCFVILFYIFSSNFKKLHEYLNDVSGLCDCGSYLGNLMGPFTDTVPGVGGTMYAVDKSTIIITNFTYTGADPGRFPAIL